MRVLFFLPYSEQAAGCRFRVHQFLPYLTARGVDCEVRELVDGPLYEILYEPGRRLRKLSLGARRAAARVRDVLDARDYDVLFVYRECFPFGPAFLESYLKTLGKPLVYDFDDAIYLLPEANALKELVRAPYKTAAITRLSSEVIVCNEHLRAFASAFNQNVSVIPTSVDTDQFRVREYPANPAPPGAARPIRIGWIGSHSTARYLDRIKGALRRVAEQCPIEFLVVGAGKPVSIPGVRVIDKAWKLDEEIEDLRSLDIGVYPLEDSLWERGKPGFKTVEYMAVGVPGVISPVGSNPEFVKEDENGFLASTEDDWVAKLTRLATDPALRRRIGLAGRKTAVDRFSLAANAPRLLSILERAAASGRVASAAARPEPPDRARW